MNSSDRAKLNLLGLPDSAGAGRIGDSTRGVGTIVEDAIAVQGGDITTLAARVTVNEAALAVIAAAPQVVSATTPVVNWALGNVFTLTTNGNEVLTFTGATTGKTILVVVTAGGSHTVTFPTALWVGGAQPVQTASGKDAYTFTCMATDIYIAQAAQALA